MQRYTLVGRGAAGHIRPHLTGTWCKHVDHLLAVAEIDDLLYKTTEALIEMAMMYGGKHEKECPQDDTCDCHYAAFNKMVNDAVKSAYDHFHEIGREPPTELSSKSS